MLVCENEAGEIAIHYRGQRLAFRELLPAATALSEGRFNTFVLAERSLHGRNRRAVVRAASLGGVELVLDAS